MKFRGVTIGAVGEIDVAPDRRHVEVDEELGLAELRRLGFVGRKDSSEEVTPPAEVRAQIASIGITGVKYLALDFFDPRTTLPPELPLTRRPTTSRRPRAR